MKFYYGTLFNICKLTESHAHLSTSVPCVHEDAVGQTGEDSECSSRARFVFLAIDHRRSLSHLKCNEERPRTP